MKQLSLFRLPSGHMSDSLNIVDLSHQIVLVGWIVASFFNDFEANTNLCLLTISPALKYNGADWSLCAVM